MRNKKPGNSAFTDEEVKWIKQQMIAGVNPIAICQVYRCSAETIRRIKRGETYTEVVVDGEEVLRAPQIFTPVGIPPVRKEGYTPAVLQRTQAEWDKETEESLARLAALEAGKAPRVGEDLELPDQFRKLMGLD